MYPLLLLICLQFLLTRPSRDVTFWKKHRLHHRWISTHTPLAGRDNINFYNKLAVLRFLLTRPSRDVTIFLVLSTSFHRFLLTRPSRDVTSSGMNAIKLIFTFLLTRPSRDVTEVYYD